MALIDQALLGYRDGHRLLASSAELPRQAISALVAATDVSAGTHRVLLGMPVPATGLYALCTTWPAPTVSRPGAVWAHALLAGAGTLAGLSASGLLAHLGGTGRTLIEASECSVGVSLPAADQDAPGGAGALDPDDLIEVIRAAYASRHPVASIADPGRAEISVLAVWSEQWAALRESFAFRVNAEPPRGLSDGFSLVVSLSEDRLGSVGSRDAGWVRELADELTAAGRRGRLLEFFGAFGPLEDARPSSVRGLGRIWSLIHSEALGPTAALVQARYPSPGEGRELKAALLGSSQDWWGAPECARVAALLNLAVDGAWPLEDLDVHGRIAELVRRGEGADLLAQLPRQLTGRAAETLTEGLKQNPVAEIIGPLSGYSEDLAVDLLLDTTLRTESGSWKLLSSAIAGRAIGHDRLAGDPAVLRAALIAGHAGPAADNARPAALREAISALDGDLLATVARASGVELLVAAARPHDVLRFTLADAPVTPERRRDALQATRRDADETWLRVAARAVGDDHDALAVVFGPLHLAITEDRLPRELWADMGPSMPAAKDPARRLRRLLVQRVRQEHWQQRQLAQALRGAGPHADEVLRDLDDDDPLTKVFKRVLKRVRRGLR